MGSPISPSIANLFVEQLEGKALDSFLHNRPKTWLRYVDDVFSILKKAHVKVLFRHLNNN